MSSILRSARTPTVLVVAVLCLTLPAPASGQEAVEYYATDALGSVRVVFDAAGNVLGRMDYAPFGEELYAGLFLPADRFAQLTRDGEAGQDYAQARMYQPRSGRFNASDAVYAAPFRPQGWNRYTYALNNPLRFTDPSGLCPTCPVFHSGVVEDLPDGLRGVGAGGNEDEIEAIGEDQNPTGGMMTPLPAGEHEALTNAVTDIMEIAPTKECQAELNKIPAFSFPDFKTYLKGGANFYDGTQSTVRAATSIYPPVAAASWQRLNPQVTSIASLFAAQPGINAITSVVTRNLTVYIRPGVVDTSNQGRNSSTRGFIVHEALHGYGAGRSDYSDQGLSSIFGLRPPSIRISKHLASKCK